MIEVEAKFRLTPETKAKLLTGAAFVGVKEFVVEFWDNDQWQLGLTNLSLKRKNGHFELKAPMAKQNDGSSYTTIMDEISDEKMIAQKIGIELTKNLESSLIKNAFRPRASIKTIRTTYNKAGFIIDLDEATFSLVRDNTPYHYEIAEIELQVADNSETQAAHEKIGQFAQEHGLTLANTRGKYMEFIYQNYPEHYQNLVKIGVMDK
ncbi:MAG: CYTH domain-containing protein [Candidatus Abawacabacteria bacterium]|nr:CYTH domain-containing protein [Candidatus Abawacabacteria bacterium]